MASCAVRRAIHGVSAVPLPTRHFSIAEVESRLASSVSRHLGEGHVLGGSVCVVRRGEIVLAKGFGCVDLAGNPVDGSTTLFRAGSVSKVLTWTAVMQLVEKGVIDESRDISHYLDFPILRRFQAPILISHLMTHSAGFESNHFGYMAAWTAGDVQPLARIVAHHVPVQVRAPGELAVYSNWGPAVAGRIVELASGMAFEDYVERHLFRPLKMAHSTFREPVPTAWGPQPTGFVRNGGDFVEHPFEYYRNIGPAGSLTTTARDIGNFMIAHLMGGSFDGKRLLSEDAVKKMHARAHASHACLDGVTLGFYEAYRNGRRTIGHSGATCSFESRLTLIPEESLGIFVACNTGGGTGFCDAVVNDLIDSLFPAQLPQVHSQGLHNHVSAYSGTYALGARSHSKSEKLLGLHHTVNVLAKHGKLVIKGLTEDGPSEWVEITGNQGVFRRIDGEEMIAFRPPRPGAKPQLLGPGPLSPHVPISFFGTRRFTEVVQLLAPPISALCAVGLVQGDGAGSVAGWLSTGLAITNVLIIAGVQVAFASDQYSLLVRLPWRFEATSVLAAISLILTVLIGGLGSVAVFAAAFTAASGTIVVTALLALGFSYWLKYWNILRFDIG